MILEGEAEAVKEVDGNAMVVKELKVGDYFGEIALLKNEPRAVNVVARTKMMLVYLDRQSFMRLLGPMEDILRRNIAFYKNYC
jgi:cAMP-dependent protein kinase regulator